ncbi:MAG TPA: amidohydrolase family protein [Nevskiaceae bacterium]|nr:amidohydrolase family protein [Nevskiaceae bacterium]
MKPATQPAAVLPRAAEPTHCDLLIRNGLLFDGTGTAPQRLDVAVLDGRIAALATALVPETRTQVVDASGCWLMPGLLDIHTHFDLEVELDARLPEAVRHGTTTVITSNCSLGIAFGAQRRGGDDPIVDCFARVENVPKSILRKVADRATWHDSQAYLEHLAGLSLGPNVVPMIPHSMLRVEVMGLKASISRDPTPAELERMEALVDKGMSEGYVGFSTDALPFHFLANAPNTDKQIPTQFAPQAELRRLTAVVRRWGRVWQATPPKDDTLAVIRTFCLSCGRLYQKPLKVTAVAALDLFTNRSVLTLGRLLSRAINSRLMRGHLRFQALSAPFKVWADGPILPIAEEIPVLRRLNACDLEDRESRAAIMADPAWQHDFRRMWERGKHGLSLARLKRWLRLDDNVLPRDLRELHFDASPIPDWNGKTFQSVYERLRQWQATGRGAWNALEERAFAALPNPIGDDCAFLMALLRQWDTELRWWTVVANRNREITKRLLFDPQLLPGFNDSGAHLANMAFYDGNLRMLKFAQEDGLAKVAQAVHRLTQEPAEFFNVDAGVVALGARADLVLVDPVALKAYEPERCIEYVARDAFACRQLVNRPHGVVRQVFIAGQSAWDAGHYTATFGSHAFGRVLLDRDHAQSESRRIAAAA